MAPNYAVPPGSFLEEWMVEARRYAEGVWPHLALSELQMNDFLNGGHQLDDVLAARLARLTGILATRWLGWEKQYRDDLSRIAEQLRVDTDGLAKHWFWRAEEEDTIGGFCIQPDWDKRTPAQGGFVLVGLISDLALARRIAHLHNATLWKHDEDLTRQDVDHLWDTGTPVQVVRVDPAHEEKD